MENVLEQLEIKRLLKKEELRKYSLKGLLRNLVGDRDFANNGEREREFGTINSKIKDIGGGTFIPDAVLNRTLSTDNSDFLLNQKTIHNLAISDKITLFEKIGVELYEEELGVQIAMPGVASSSIPVWSIEDVPVSSTDPTFSNGVSLPKTLASSVNISRPLLIGMGEGGVQLILRELDSAIYNKMAISLFEGTGTTGESMGLKTMSDVNEIDATAGLNTAMIRDAIENSETNSYRTNLSWVCSPATKNILMGTEKISGGEKMIMEDNKIYGYPTLSQAGLEDGILYLGDFSNILEIRYNKGNEIRVDQFNSRKGFPNLMMFKSYDLIIRSGASFNRIINIS